MDPLTHGLLGAAAAQSCLTRQLGRPILLVGLAAGMAADGDVFIRSQADPMLHLIYHRHFTHALLFIPIGAAIAAGAFLLVPWGWRRARWVLLAALAAYATHGLLDCTTSYGTLWLWPFSKERVAWDLLAIIDVVFTGLLLVGVLAAVVWRRAMPARVALAAALVYVGAAVVQHDRAETAAVQLAAEHHHRVENLRVMPSLGQAQVWRSVYLADSEIWADEVRTPWLRPVEVKRGQRAPAVTLEGALRLAHGSAKVRGAIEEFYWFADDFVGLASQRPLVLSDLRYCLEPGGMHPLWGLLIDPRMAPSGYTTVSFPHPPRALFHMLWGGPSQDK